ncbi:hypothetical protein ACH4ZX_15610 [Streptomyces sp. NPDC020490]|uniref:hypothetical protein n=1 Tax=Streptomyces sp. NPDC020490 TaxID=3365078 RepID=UPI0037B8ACC0
MSVTTQVFALAEPAPGVTYEEMLPHLDAEARHTWQLYAAGTARDVWSRTDALGAAVTLNVSDVAEAERVLEGFPLAGAGLVRFDVVLPLGPFTPLGLLFGGPGGGGKVPPSADPGGGRKVIAWTRPGERTDPDRTASLLADELKVTWSLWRAGVIRELYARTDAPGALAVMEADGVAQAQSVLATLPLVAEGLLAFEAVEVGTYQPWEALFGVEKTKEDTR